MNRHSLLIRNWIGKETDWDQKDNAEAFLKEFVTKLEPNAQVKVTDEKKFSNDYYTVHLSIQGKQTTISVSWGELINCNSLDLRGAEKSQKQLAETVRCALGEITRKHRKLGFLK